MTDSPEPEQVPPNQQLQSQLAQCYECFVQVTAAVTETEYRQKVDQLRKMLSNLSKDLEERAPAQARCQMLMEMEQVTNHRQQLLGRLEGAWNAAQSFIETAEGGGVGEGNEK